MALSTREKILVAALAVTIIVAAALVLVATRRIRNVGQIRGVGVGIYWDKQCTLPATEIDWGLLDPGDLAGVTLFFKNERNVNFTLTFEVGNWTPAEASTFLTFDWNYTDYVFTPEQVEPIQCTLYVALDIHDIYTFGFDTVFVATEV